MKATCDLTTLLRPVFGTEKTENRQNFASILLLSAGDVDDFRSETTPARHRVTSVIIEPEAAENKAHLSLAGTD